MLYKKQTEKFRYTREYKYILEHKMMEGKNHIPRKDISE